MRLVTGVAANGLIRWLPLSVSAVVAFSTPLRAQELELPKGVTPELIVQGKGIFLDQGLCYICHGVDATGARGVGADLTDDEWWHNDGSYEAIVNQILTGVTTEQARNPLGAMMPPRGGSAITEEQVRAVAAYVWSLRLAERAPGDSAARPPVALPLSNSLPVLNSSRSRSQSKL